MGPKRRVEHIASNEATRLAKIVAAVVRNAVDIDRLDPAVAVCVAAAAVADEARRLIEPSYVEALADVVRMRGNDSPTLAA